ncbi:HET-domain-containing protein [Hyaloscypha bicolor E]|uniref:HET-domain-containing protein n=1 Tax=Hyaloscypha bicolor E TaxID=1095630 RepID=A0A2J6SPB9_9HELO|nr:HET-domain-containing protein [Hyaloscypha bicolor E]PMD52624.1 HET-domain-containing protein [Hyaloscypha bicolor E]
MPSYVALSYCWGDPSNRVEIIVSDSKVSVTTSLETALRRLRREGSLSVWADALCINQADVVERSLQIRQMRAIYCRAKCVLSWLVDWSGWEASVASVKRLSTAFIALEDNDAVPQRVVDCVNWLDLASLFHQPYWTRAWVVQEMAVAAELKILCGDVGRITLGSVNDAVEACKRMAGCPSAYAFLEKYPCDYIGQLHTLRVQTLSAEPVKLIDILSRMCSSRSSDIHDKVFAFLGLAYDANTLLPSPAYAQSTYVISREMTLTTIKLMNSLDFPVLFARKEASAAATVGSVASVNERPNEGPDKEAKPSWVPDWFHAATWADDRKDRYILRRDLFLDERNSESTIAVWKATSGSTPRYRIVDQVLTTRGIVFDRIAYISTVFGEATTPIFPMPLFSSKPCLMEQPRNSMTPPLLVLEEHIKELWERNRAKGAFTPMVNSLLFWLLVGFISSSPSVGAYGSGLNFRELHFAHLSYFDLFVARTSGVAYGRKVDEIRQWLATNGQLAIGGARFCDLLRHSKPIRYGWLITEDARKMDNRVLEYVYAILSQGRRLGTTCADRNSVTNFEFLVGWVPENASTGDSVALLVGCSVPVILRRRPAGGYWIVGDAHFPTTMYGEAAKDMYTWQNIDLY